MSSKMARILSLSLSPPAGPSLARLVVAIYLKARHPDCHLVRVQAQKVVALRKHLRRSSKSDKIDGRALAKMPFIDAEQLGGERVLAVLG